MQWETYSLRTPASKVENALVRFAFSVVLAALVSAVGQAVALSSGAVPVAKAAALASGVLLVLGLILAVRRWWRGWVTLTDLGDHIAVQYGPRGVRVRGGAIGKRETVAFKTVGGHGVYRLSLVQGRLEVMLGLTGKVFPEPYLGLVAWLKGRGVLLDERWAYPRLG